MRRGSVLRRGLLILALTCIALLLFGHLRSLDHSPSGEEGGHASQGDLLGASDGPGLVGLTSRDDAAAERDEPSRLSVKVLGATGVPVPEAVLWLWAENEKHESMLTNVAGEARFEGAALDGSVRASAVSPCWRCHNSGLHSRAPTLLGPGGPCKVALSEASVEVSRNRHVIQVPWGMPVRPRFRCHDRP